MNICLLNVLHEALDKRVYHKVARSLDEAGHEVVSIAPKPAGTPLPIEADAFARFVFTPPSTTFRQRFWALLRLVRLGGRERADLYVAPEPESWVAALLIKTLFGGKVALDMHEHIPSEFAKFFPAWLRRFVSWLTLCFMRLFARYTDLIILTRESFEDCWEGLSTPRVVVINTNHLQPPCTEIPEELRALGRAHPLLIHQGIFGDIRGSWQLLEAMKLLIPEMPDIRCLVLGEYVYGEPEAYRSSIREAGLEDQLILRGKVPFEAVPAFIAASRIGLILFQPGPVNHTLAMPHKLFDYMREGKPTIAPAFAVEVARIVREADCGLLVDVTSPRAIADAVLQLLRHPEEAERLGRNGRRAVETTYNWQQDEQRLLDAVRALE